MGACGGQLVVWWPHYSAVVTRGVLASDLASVTTSSPISILSDDDVTLMTDDLLLTEAEEGAS